jgi:hypothetical protein
MDGCSGLCVNLVSSTSDPSKPFVPHHASGELTAIRFDHDARWSETGDRYIIKLFRDFVFHSVDEEGRPLMNLSHVLACLNKVGVWRYRQGPD